MKGPLKYRIRVGLGVIVILATLLVLQLALVSRPLAGSAPAFSEDSADAYAAVGAEDHATLPNVSAKYRMGHRMAFGLGVLLLIGSASLWWYVERRILGPLEDMTGVVAAMSEGHLDQTLDADGGTELDQLADLINSFSVNQQEGLLFVWNQAGSGLKGLQTIAERLEALRSDESAFGKSAHTALSAEVRRTRNLLEEIQALVRTYYFYDVCLEDQKALAAMDAE